MINALVIATAVSIPSALVQDTAKAQEPGIALPRLTVPQARLPVGCALSPSDTVRLDGNRVQGGWWAGLPIDTNPWIGADRPVIATVRERMGGTVATPDGPPVIRSQLSRYRLHLADGVEEAYAAVYRQLDPGRRVIVVYGSRFSTSGAPRDDSIVRRSPENPRLLRVTIGPVAVVVDGDDGDCFDAIGSYLKALTQ